MGEQHTYRVIVRGTWDALTDEARQRLLGEASEHGMLSMRFTEDGSLSYEPSPLKHFSWRTPLRQWGRLPGSEVDGHGPGHDEGQPEVRISAVIAQRSWSRQAPSM